jgi:hypothetical protein
LRKWTRRKPSPVLLLTEILPVESPKSHREGNSGMSSATSSGPASTISERREDFPAEAMVPVSLTSPEEKPRILPTRCRLARRGSGRKDGAHGGSTRLIRSHSSPVSPSLDMPGKARSIRSRNRHQTRAASSKASNGAAKRSARATSPITPSWPSAQAAGAQESCPSKDEASGQLSSIINPKTATDT